MMDERTRVLAKVRTGVDADRIRTRRNLTIAALAVAAGVGVALWANRAQARRSEAAPEGNLTQNALRSQNFSDSRVSRILSVQEFVDQHAFHRGLDRDLVNGVILAESGFNPLAVSPVGAQGLMQIMPATQQGWESQTGVSGDAFDPEHNIFLGTYGLRKLLDRWDGNVARALASYNWGVGNVTQHPDAYPSVTDQYILDVLAGQRRFQAARAA